MLQPVRKLNPEQFDAVARQWMVKLPGEELVACFHKVRKCLAEGDVGSATFQVALDKFLGQFVLTAHDSLKNLQSDFPHEFGPTFENRKSQCVDLWSRFRGEQHREDAELGDWLP
jgi:hypothetical protein